MDFKNCTVLKKEKIFVNNIECVVLLIQQNGTKRIGSICSLCGASTHPTDWYRCGVINTQSLKEDGTNFSCSSFVNEISIDVLNDCIVTVLKKDSEEFKALCFKEKIKTKQSIQTEEEIQICSILL